MASKKQKSGKKTKKTLEQVATKHLWTVLQDIFSIEPPRIKLIVEIDEELDERDDCYAETRVKLGDDGVNTYVVKLATKAFLSDAILKGTCAHEALHIALIQYGLEENLEGFWDVVKEYLHKAVEILQRVYGTADEFIVGVLEPIVALYLIPPPEPLRGEDRQGAWVVTIHQPISGEKKKTRQRRT